MERQREAKKKIFRLSNWLLAKEASLNFLKKLNWFNRRSGVHDVRSFWVIAKLNRAFGSLILDLQALTHLMLPVKAFHKSLLKAASKALWSYLTLSTVQRLLAAHRVTLNPEQCSISKNINMKSINMLNSAKQLYKQTYQDAMVGPLKKRYITSALRIVK